MQQAFMRTMAHDFHGAKQAMIDEGVFEIQELNGAEFTYHVNSLGELIRNQLGGGTSVITAHVHTFTATRLNNQQLWQVSVALNDGLQDSIEMVVGAKSL